MYRQYLMVLPSTQLMEKLILCSICIMSKALSGLTHDKHGLVIALRSINYVFTDALMLHFFSIG